MLAFQLSRAIQEKMLADLAGMPGSAITSDDKGRPCLRFDTINISHISGVMTVMLRYKGVAVGSLSAKVMLGDVLVLPDINGTVPLKIEVT